MPLDPEYGAVLALMQQAGILQPYSGASAADVRGRMAPLEEMRRKSAVPIAIEADTRFAGPGGEVAIRLYRARRDGVLPVLIYFHGGGFVLGDLDSHAHICRELALRVDCVVVSVDYRRAPEHRFPSAIDDALAAVRWVAAHASTFGGDGTRLAVGGDSAGANLATISALRCRDENGPALCFQLLMYPGTHARPTHASRRDNAAGYFLTEEAIEWFFQQYLPAGTDRDHPWVSPLLAPDLGRLPPALVITAEFDPLRDEGEAYAARMAQAGVCARAKRYDGAIHGFFGPSTTTGRAALADAAAALEQSFRVED